MLDKLSLNSFLIILFFTLFSCSSKTKHEAAPGVYHTELLCPNHDVILIRYATLEEVKIAIQKAYANKRKFNTSEKYTVISFAGNRSMRLDKLTPEEAVICNLREIYYPYSDKYKKRYTESPGYKFFSRH